LETSPTSSASSSLELWLSVSLAFIMISSGSWFFFSMPEECPKLEEGESTLADSRGLAAFNSPGGWSGSSLASVLESEEDV
jgi:hypothetical protein